MLQSNRYSVLFEPVRIGPVTAKNRFYQVPHCCGMGHIRPQAHAATPTANARSGPTQIVHLFTPRAPGAGLMV